MSSLGLLFSSPQPETAVWRTANRHSGYAESPYNTYPTRDGYVAVICVTEAHWVALAKAMDRADLVTDPRFESLAARVGHMDEIDEIVTAWTSGHAKDELVAVLQDHGIPCAPVKDLDEVVTDPNLWARGMLQHLDHPEYGRITAPHSPMRFGEGKRAPLSPSPALGQHNHDVYRELLDISEDELADLATQKVI
jgi:crotonobetainyl-CoA:carnitine CoA-transferase CaiB-like acyl-CoA transferase